RPRPDATTSRAARSLTAGALCVPHDSCTAHPPGGPAHPDVGRHASLIFVAWEGLTEALSQHENMPEGFLYACLQAEHTASLARCLSPVASRDTPERHR